MTRTILLNGAHTFYNTAGTGPNATLVHKAVALAPTAPLVYALNPGESDYREFWIHDTGYVFENYPRLQPSTLYQWAIWYTNASFTNGGTFGPFFQFTTVSEAYVTGALTANADNTVGCLVVYWQHPDGSLARDPAENVTTFEPLAAQLQAIHMNDLQPTVKTLIFGTEQMAASYGGLDEVTPLNNKQQVYVPDIMAFPGWYTLGRRHGDHCEPMIPDNMESALLRAILLPALLYSQ